MTEEFTFLRPNDEWMRFGACRGTDPNLFHPERGDHITQRMALQICNGTLVEIRSGQNKGQMVGEPPCPVRDQCRAFIMSLPPREDQCGIYGGLSHKARRRLRLGNGKTPEFLPCGSVRAYRRHLRLREQPCESCRQANAADKNERNLRLKVEREAS